jgi:uncharacterized protein (TIGR02421 family)
VPGRGRLHIDRQLPFLCVNRTPSDREDFGTPNFVKSEASYLFVTGSKEFQKNVSTIVDGVVATLAPEFGAFMLVELWSGSDEGKATDPRAPEVSPRFKVYAPPTSTLSPIVDTLVGQLKKIKVLRQTVEVDVERSDRIAPPGMAPLLSKARAAELKCCTVGVELPPVWRNVAESRDYPLLMRSLNRRFSNALRRGIFEFVRGQTTHKPPHYHALGRRAVVKAVWDVDEQLAEVSNAFDFLLQVTPINSDAAWNQFKSQHFEHRPDFHYLPTPMNPALLKRKLYRIPVERVEDPALHHVFRQKQEELDRKITMMRDRNTPAFLYGSMQLYGGVRDGLYRLADTLLTEIPSRSRDDAKGGQVDAETFARFATEEFDFYRQSLPTFKARAEITGRVAGVMVSRGKLLINKKLMTPKSRINALLQHEVGTHLLTYYNGRTQPFRQLYSGLAGYDELQEGLAVLAEYLVNGLGRPRMRQLAARVVAAKHMVDGATFVDTFRLLDRNYDFSQRSAYNITMRIYRGGGLTKDAVYLRGLHAILKYLGSGGDIEPLFVGKMAAEHVPIINELQFRKILHPAPLRPRYMSDEQAIARLEKVRSGLSVVDMLRPEAVKTSDTDA